LPAYDTGCDPGSGGLKPQKSLPIGNDPRWTVSLASVPRHARQLTSAPVATVNMTPRGAGRLRKEATKMATSKKDASVAGKKLPDRKATKTEKSIAASDLAQGKGRGMGKGR
jgi:hypothetical protein